MGLVVASLRYPFLAGETEFYAREPSARPALAGLAALFCKSLS